MTKALYSGDKGVLAPGFRSASDGLGPTRRYYFSLYASDYCLAKDLKGKLSPGWRQEFAVVSHNLNDRDYSCFVKLDAGVITR